MSLVGNVIGWGVFLALINYMAYSLTGLTPMWGLSCAIGKHLTVYVQLVNLGLGVSLIIGGAWYGLPAVIKCAAVFVGFNMLPHIAAAVFAFGKSCP